MRYYELIVAHIVLSILAFQFETNMYFITIAVSWILIPLFFILNGYKNCVIWLWFAYAVNNLVDEIFQCAEYASVSEYIFVVFITYVIIKMKCQQKK